jgi:hypothetical protein
MDRQFGIAQLKAFNAWRDDFLIEASTLLLIAGFILGTIDIFVGGGVATATWFKISWAVVQALAIDGLFFAVWGRVARAAWTRANLRKNISLVSVGLVLGLVAALVNDILTYQQVNSLADSIDAIRRLGIDVQAFTTARAILVVAVGVLVQLFCRSDGTRDSVPDSVQIEEMVRDTGQLPVVYSVQNSVQGVQRTDSVHLDKGDSVHLDSVRDILRDRPTISVRQLAQELKVSKTTAQNWRHKVLEVKDDRAGTETVD